MVCEEERWKRKEEGRESIFVVLECGMDVKGGKAVEIGGEGRSVHQPQSKGDEEEREKRVQIGRCRRSSGGRE